MESNATIRKLLWEKRAKGLDLDLAAVKFQFSSTAEHFHTDSLKFRAILRGIGHGVQLHYLMAFDLKNMPEKGTDRYRYLVQDINDAQKLFTSEC